MLILLHILYIYSEYLWSYLVNRNRLLDEPRENEANSSEEYERNVDYGAVRGSRKFFCSDKESEESQSELNEILSSDNLENEPENVLDRFTFHDELEEFDGAVYEFDTKKITFFPPVYVQRYVTVVNVLKDERWKNDIKKVVDIGCSELGFFKFLKDIDGLEKILEIDIDKELLEEYSYRVHPWVSDYLKDRSGPLEVTVLCGNVSRPDRHLEGVDAVVAIELIEHLYPPDLEALPFNVFGVIKPRIAIFTTPNEEFNVLFHNFRGLRHDDHKFEWTRSEFESWARNICSRYPDYEVNFLGIGPGPNGSNNLGCCSQGAVFIRTDTLPVEKNLTKPLSDFVEYEVIDHVDYPFRRDERSKDRITLDDALNFTRVAVQIGDYSNRGRIEIPLATILMRVNKTCKSVDKLKQILEEADYKVEKDEDGYYILILPESFFYSEDENGMNSEPEIENIEYVQHEDGVTDHVSDDWDSVEQDGISWTTDSSESGDSKNVISDVGSGDSLAVLEGTCSLTKTDDIQPEESVCPSTDVLDDETFELDKMVDELVSGNFKFSDKLKADEPECNSFSKNVSFEISSSSLFLNEIENAVNISSENSNSVVTTFSKENQITCSLKQSGKFLNSDECINYGVNKIRSSGSRYYIDGYVENSVPDDSDDERETQSTSFCVYDSNTLNSLKTSSGVCENKNFPISNKHVCLADDFNSCKNVDSLSAVNSFTSESNLTNASEPVLSDNLKKNYISLCVNKGEKNPVKCSDENPELSFETPDSIIIDENVKCSENSFNEAIVGEVISNSCQSPLTVSRIEKKESSIQNYKPSQTISKKELDHESVLTVSSAYEIDECIESVQAIIKKFDIDGFNKKKLKDGNSKELPGSRDIINNKGSSIYVLETRSNVSEPIQEVVDFDGKFPNSEGYAVLETESVVSCKYNNSCLNNVENDVISGSKVIPTYSTTPKNVQCDSEIAYGEGNCEVSAMEADNSNLESENNVGNTSVNNSALSFSNENTTVNKKLNVLEFNSSDTNTNTNTSCSSGVEVISYSDNNSTYRYSYKSSSGNPMPYSVQCVSGQEGTSACTCYEAVNKIDLDNKTLASCVHDFSGKSAVYCMNCSSLSSNFLQMPKLDCSVVNDTKVRDEPCDSDNLATVKNNSTNFAQEETFSSQSIVFHNENEEEVIKTHHFENDKLTRDKTEYVSDDMCDLIKSPNSKQCSSRFQNTCKLQDKNYDKMFRSRSLGHFVQYPYFSDECNKSVKPSDSSMLAEVSYGNSELQQKLSAERCDERKLINENVHCEDDDSESDILIAGLERQDSFSPDKAGDSGYPNSNSGRDMEMDLTPEQVKEIMTEGESSLENSPLDSPVEEVAAVIIPHPLIVHLGDNVENGDVANNNRDGEGNNMIGQAAVVGEPREFHAVIDHPQEMPLMAVAGINENDDNENKNNENDFKNRNSGSNFESRVEVKENSSACNCDIPFSRSCTDDGNKVSIKRSKTFLDKPFNSKSLDRSNFFKENVSSETDSTFKQMEDKTETSITPDGGFCDEDNGKSSHDGDENKNKNNHDENGLKELDTSIEKRENLGICPGGVVVSSSCTFSNDEGTIKKSNTVLDEPLSSKSIDSHKLYSGNSYTKVDEYCSVLKLAEDETVLKSTSYGSTQSVSNLKDWNSVRMGESNNCDDLKKYADLLVNMPSVSSVNCVNYIPSAIFLDSTMALQSNLLPSCSGSAAPNSAVDVLSNSDRPELLDSYNLLPTEAVPFCSSEASTNMVDSLLNTENRSLPSLETSSHEARNSSASQDVTSLQVPTSLFDEALDLIIQDIIHELLLPDLEPFADWLLQIQLELITAEGAEGEGEQLQNVNEGHLRVAAGERGNNFVNTDSDQELIVEADVKGGGDSSVDQ